MDSKEKMQKTFELVNAEYTETAFESGMQEYLSIISLGLDPDKVSLHRYIPVRIYVSSPKKPDHLYDKIKDFLQLCGFKVVSSNEYKVKSWFSKIIAKTLTPKTKKELLKELDNGRRALKLYGIDQQQAEIDNKLANAAATLIKALENEERGVLQAGSTLVVKNASGIVSQTLSQEELQFIEENPSLILQPDLIIKALSWSKAKDSFYKKDPEIEYTSKLTGGKYPRLPRKVDKE